MTARPSNTMAERWAFAVLIVAAFSVSSGYGVVLPRLPELLARLPGSGRGEAWQASHVAGLTAAFFGAALVAAPSWGWISDRFGRRITLALGGLGFAVGLLSTGAAGSLTWLYASRLLDGAAAAAVAPAALAYVADRCQDPDLRAKRFAWINGAVFAGYLGGPLIGVLAGRIDVHAPFLLPAVAAAGAALLALFACRGAQLRPIPAHFPWRARLAPLAYLLGVSAVAAGGVVALEIAVTLPLSQTASGRGSAALLLSLCGAVMFLTQMVLFSGHDAARRATRLIRPLLAGLAATLLVAPFVQGLWLLAGVVAITASAAATLNVLASYLTSRLSPSAHGLGLGLQYAAVSAGQMMAALAAGPSAAAGVPYALWFAGAAAVGLAMIPATAPNPEAR